MVNYDDLNSDVLIALDDIMDNYLMRYDIHNDYLLGTDKFYELVTAVSDEIHSMLTERIKESFK